MPRELTHTETCARLVRHLTETLRALPPGPALALRHPELPSAVFNEGTLFSSAWDSLDDTDALGSLDIRYWLLGAAPADAGRYLDLLLRAWAGFGWTTQDRRSVFPRSGYARTSDGFGFSVVESVNGYLSLSGSTPSFRIDPAATGLMPRRIG